MTSSNYLLNTATAEERARLAAVQAELDPGTIRHLEALGVTAGMRCLEVGAGAGSIAAWLSERVGPTGQVVATDIEPVHLVALARERTNIEPLRHDILKDLLPAASFDVVHVRWLLHHLAEARRAIAAMVAALKPGGWLLAEELDVSSVQADLSASREQAALVQRFVDAMRTVLAKRGGNYDYGRQLFADVRASGLVEVRAEGRSAMSVPGTPLNTNLRYSVQILRGPLTASGVMSEKDAEELLAMSDEASFTLMGYTTMAVWGRKPEG
jgi:2-polyprenyl-3-methyl-5-hydroxy-6-metoxy-1,4-benzoquinol methylase